MRAKKLETCRERLNESKFDEMNPTMGVQGCALTEVESRFPKYSGQHRELPVGMPSRSQLLLYVFTRRQRHKV